MVNRFNAEWHKTQLYRCNCIRKRNRQSSNSPSLSPAIIVIIISAVTVIIISVATLIIISAVTVIIISDVMVIIIIAVTVIVISAIN